MWQSLLPSIKITRSGIAKTFVVSGLLLGVNKVINNAVSKINSPPFVYLSAEGDALLRTDPDTYRLCVSLYNYNEVNEQLFEQILKKILRIVHLMAYIENKENAVTFSLSKYGHNLCEQTKQLLTMFYKYMASYQPSFEGVVLQDIADTVELLAQYINAYQYNIAISVRFNRINKLK